MTDQIVDLIYDTVDKILSEFCENEAWGSFDENGISYKHWELVEQSGILKAGLLEAQDGAGLDLSSIMRLAGLSGFHACPLPLSETLVSYWIANAVGLEIEGASVLTFADDSLCEPPILTKDGLLTGQVLRVPYGDLASHIILRCLDHEGSDTVVCICPSDLNAEAVTIRSLSCVPLASYAFSQAPVVGSRPVGGTTFVGSFRALGALMRSHEMAGAMKRSVEITVNYVKERKQFGRPLSKFQAVQHMIAVAAEHAVSSEIAAQAASLPSELNQTELLIAACKSWASESVKVVSDACHQSHGAMGFTAEYHLHYFTRRLWSWRDEFGTEHEWQRFIGDLAVEAGPDALWDMILGKQ